MKRICDACKKAKRLASFERTKSGHHRRTCAACRVRLRREADPDKWHTRRNKWQRKHRADNPAVYIVQDARISDRKRGFGPNDLTVEFVEGLLKHGCAYCGGSELRMTLDRMDNAESHLRSNVQPCCLRCNLLRGSMPYEAWKCLVPAVRKAFRLGLFGSWRSQPMAKIRA